MACLTLVNAIPVLTTAELAQGYSGRPTDGGVDNGGLFSAIKDELNQCNVKLTLLLANMSAGTNKTNLTTALAALVA